MAETFYTNGYLIDVVNEKISKGSILTNDGVIEAVGGNLTCPEGAKVVDFNGGYVSPGLFNCHTHICLDCGATSTINGRDAAVTIMALGNCKKLIQSGVTYIRDVGGRNYIDLDIRDAANKGLIDAPEMQAAGKLLCMTGGHGWQSGRECDSPDECRKAAREQIRAGADLVKMMATGGVMSRGDQPGATQLTEEEMRPAIEAAHNAGLKTATHAQGMEGIKNALRAGIDSVEHGFFLDDWCFDFMKEHNVFLDPTLSAMYWIKVKGTAAGIPDWAVRKVERTIEAHRQSVANAYKAGVKITLGTDAGTPFNDFEKTSYEMVLMKDIGMDAWTILRSGTITAAELCGVEKTHGTIEPGKTASFTIYGNDPVKDINAVTDCRMTVIRDRVYPLV
ncbi:MAG: amidohydrolase family protein [Lachnospiraceae bacterium]|jgi:imidazolonepropionase-like amidohydrolase